MKLNDLNFLEEAIISKVVASDNIKRRLFDVGFINGSRVKALFGNGNMRAYYVRGAVIAIRLEDTSLIEVTK